MVTRTYEATVRIEVTNENEEMTFTQDELIEHLESIVVLDLDKEDQLGLEDDSDVGSVSIEWDTLKEIK